MSGKRCENWEFAYKNKALYAPVIPNCCPPGEKCVDGNYDKKTKQKRRFIRVIGDIEGTTIRDGKRYGVKTEAECIKQCEDDPRCKYAMY